MTKALRFFTTFFLLFPAWVLGQNTITSLSAGDSLFNAKNFQAAIEKYTILINQDGGDKKSLSTLYDRRALAKFNLKLYSESLIDGQKAIAADSTNGVAYRHHGLYNETINENIAAINDYTKAISYYKDSPANLSSLFISRSKIYGRLKDYDKAISDVTRVIELGINKLDGYASRGFHYESKKQYQFAIDDFSAALFYNPTDKQSALLYTQIANNYSYLKKFKEAINNYNLALLKNPSLPNIYMLRGFAYTDNHDYQLASDDYGTALKLNIGDNAKMARLYDYRASAERDMYHFDKAQEYVNAGLTANPQNESLYWNQAIIYSSQGEFEQAIPAYEKAMKFYQNDNKVLASMHYAVATDFYNLKDYKRVIEECDKTVSLNPDFASAYYLMGKVYNKQSQTKNLAIKNFSKAISSDTSKTSTSYIFSQFYSGNKDIALKVLHNQILDTSDQYGLSSIYYNTACIYAIINDRLNALNYLKKALEMGYSKKYTDRDEDFDNIRNTLEYKILIKTIE